MGRELGPGCGICENVVGADSSDRLVSTLATGPKGAGGFCNIGYEKISLEGIDGVSSSRMEVAMLGPAEEVPINEVFSIVEPEHVFSTEWSEG